MKRYVAGMILALAGPVQADGWQPLDGAGILVALTDRTVAYDTGATQRFFASGRTQYTHAEPSWGSWRVENGQYCSLWPPAPDWDCYYDSSDGAGGVTFLDQWGNDYPGTIDPE